MRVGISISRGILGNMTWIYSWWSVRSIKIICEDEFVRLINMLAMVDLVDGMEQRAWSCRPPLVPRPWSVVVRTDNLRHEFVCETTQHEYILKRDIRLISLCVFMFVKFVSDTWKRHKYTDCQVYLWCWGRKDTNHYYWLCIFIYENYQVLNL